MSVRRLMDTTTQSWIEAINNKDVEQLTLLAADDHKFFVEGEAPTVGKEKVAPSWNGYFEAYPEYQVFVDEYYDIDNAHYLLGHTSGSHVPREYERVPSCLIWGCIVMHGKVEEWSIYPGTDENRDKFGIPHISN